MSPSPDLDTLRRRAASARRQAEETRAVSRRTRTVAVLNHWFAEVVLEDSRLAAERFRGDGRSALVVRMVEVLVPSGAPDRTPHSLVVHTRPAGQ